MSLHWATVMLAYDITWLYFAVEISKYSLLHYNCGKIMHNKCGLSTRTLYHPYHFIRVISVSGNNTSIYSCNYRAVCIARKFPLKPCKRKFVPSLHYCYQNGFGCNLVGRLVSSIWPCWVAQMQGCLVEWELAHQDTTGKIPFGQRCMGLSFENRKL